VVLVLLLVGGCGTTGKSFSPLGSVTLIKVKKNNGVRVREDISELRLINQIVEFVDSNRKDWGRPWYGIPVPTVNLEFYDGQIFKGSFGLGKNFFETQRDGGFWSKDVPADQVGRLADLLAISKENLNR
jgi:hypothetical protein